jgi:hypothetical protein
MELATQKAQIQEVQPLDREALLSSSKSVFLISKLWWDKWCSHVGYSIERNDPSPGPIYNHSLLTGSGHNWKTLRLRQDLQEGQDFVMLTSTAWRRLFQWYGGGPEIPIFLIGQEPDLNPIMLEIWMLDSLTAPVLEPGKTILLSAELTIKDAQFHISQRLGVPYYKYDLKLLDSPPGEFESFLNDSLTLKNAGVVYGSKVALIPKEQNVAIALPACPELDEETQVRINNSDEDDMELAMAIQASLTERTDEDAPTSGTESTGMPYYSARPFIMPYF